MRTSMCAVGRLDTPARGLCRRVCLIARVRCLPQANLAHLLRDVSELSPMEALQLLAWLQEYRERLAAAAAPKVHPPVSDAQAALVQAYAAQSRVTWESCTFNLHQADVQRLSAYAAGPRPDLTRNRMRRVLPYARTYTYLFRYAPPVPCAPLTNVGPARRMSAAIPTAASTRPSQAQWRRPTC